MTRQHNLKPSDKVVANCDINLPDYYKGFAASVDRLYGDDMISLQGELGTWTAAYFDLANKPKFASGDVVRNNSGGEYTIKCVKTRYGNDSEETFTGPMAYDYICGGWDYESSLTLVHGNVESLIKAGKKIEAIKAHRAATGLGLKEAKDAAEAMAAALEKPKFKVGDRVTHNAVKNAGTGVITKAMGFDNWCIKWASNFGTCTDPGDNISLAPAEPATLGDILGTALKKPFKIGDRVKYTGDFTPRLIGMEGTIKAIAKVEVNWDCCEHSAGCMAESLTLLPPEATGGFFKPGDVVTCPGYSEKKFTVKSVNGEWVTFTNHGYALARTLTLVGPSEPISIVALLKDGKPRSNEKPFVHKTKESADTEARRLADANPGVEFGVFTLTSVSTAKLVPATTRVA